MRMTATKRDVTGGSCKPHIATARGHCQAEQLYTMRTAARDLDAVLKAQRELIRAGAYEPLGYLWWLYYEVAAGGRYAAREAVPIGARVDWMPGQVQSNTPTLALSKRAAANPLQMDSGSDLLIIGEVYPLPDIPDPLHVKKHADDPVPMIQQSLSERATATYRNFAVIQPIHQVVFRPFGKFGFGNIRARAGIGGTHLALLIDPDTRTAHFVGGKLHLGIAGG